MTFQQNKRLDPSQVQDRRGRSMGRTIAVGGGGLGLIALLVSLFFGVDLGDLTNLTGVDSSSPDMNSTTVGSDLIAECQTGADANTRQDCRIVGYVNSIQAYWESEFSAHGQQYIPAQTVLFSGATQAGCGYASGASGEDTESGSVQ